MNFYTPKGLQSIKSENPEMIEKVLNSNIANTNTEIEEECNLEDKLKSNNELHVAVIDLANIYFDVSGDLKQQADNLDLVLKTTLKGVANLEYIDLRFENRVYYK